VDTSAAWRKVQGLFSDRMRMHPSAARMSAACAKRRYKFGAITGLVPVIHVLLPIFVKKTWMAGSSGAKTRFCPAMTC
jgi:hypothetical protein